MGHVMINNTRGKDDVERASLSFLVGNVALNSGQEATLLHRPVRQTLCRG